VVVDVELHHRHDRLEFGDEGESTPSSFIRRSARSGLPCFSIRSRKMRFASGSSRRSASISVQVGGDQAHRVGMQQQAGAQRLLEDAQQVQRIGEEAAGRRR
jgi:hypothetical protein